MAQLPFLYDAEVRDQADSLVERVSCSVWPAERQRDETSGEVFDHTGEAPLRAGDALRGPNRRLVVLNGPLAGRYSVSGATPQPFTQHVGLELLRVDPVG